MCIRLNMRCDFRIAEWAHDFIFAQLHRALADVRPDQVQKQDHAEAVL